LLSLRILMYSHDDSGLGHTLRTLTIATHIAEKLENCSILLLTDLSIIGRFKFPQNVDYVHLPGLAHKAGFRYFSGGLNLELENTLKIRRKIAQSAAKTFQPNLMIIGHDLIGLQGEMQRILSFVREELPETKIIWGVPDVLGEPATVIRDWQRERVYQIQHRFLDEIWVYGDKEVFDQAHEYRIPAPIAGKIFYTGYLRSPQVSSGRIAKEIIPKGAKPPVVLITAGSGAEGFSLIDNYLHFLERHGEPASFQSLIVTGPMMRSREKRLLMERAQRLPNVIFHRFSKHMLQYVKHADLIVCTGGYNTLCEVMTYGKKAICVPMLAPPNDHLLRSQIFQKLGAVKMLHPKELTADNLGKLINDAVDDRAELALRGFQNRIPLEGLDKIVERIKLLSGLTEFRSQQANM